jgi:hypothetical protein
MSDNDRTFMSLVLDGYRLPEEIDDFVDEWHEGNGEIPLHEFLGMTPEEYGLWIQGGQFLNLIIAARHARKPLRAFANDNLADHRRLAARADRSWNMERLKQWIDQEID